MKTKFLIGVVATFAMATADAGGYTPWAVPTYAEIVSGGIAVYGSFGNEHGCTQGDVVLYMNTYIDYDAVVSMVLAAITAGRELRFYTHQCVTMSFHGGTVNQSVNGQAIYFR